MRDEFSGPTKDLLAKRVGFRCSNPECQRPTSGPQSDPAKSMNIGVAAHISAAAPGGPRYETDLTAEQRCDSTNGVWLCQVCAKLIDNDPARFTRHMLESWKRAAERAALTGLLRHDRTAAPERSRPDASKFAKVERLMPALLEQMREDLLTSPTTREFVIQRQGWVINSRDRYLAYFFEDHEDLAGKVQVLENYGLIKNVTRGELQRFRFDEALVDYLCGDV
jgi:hypothetical protein